MLQAQSLFYQGDHRAVLLLHAYTGSPNDVASLARALSRRGYTVYCPLFRGHGQDQLEELLTYSSEDWYQDSIDAVSFLRDQGHRTIVALGLSMGGMMTARLAVEQEVEGAGCFCSPVVNRNAQLPGLFQSFYEYAAYLSKKMGKPLEQFRKEWHSMEVSVRHQLEDLNQFSMVVASRMDQVTGPFYIAQGGADQLVDPEAAIELKEELINAAVDFHWFEEAPHVITVSKERIAFQESVEHFLEGVEWRR